MNHFQTTPLSNAVLLLMAMLDDRREPLDAAVQRRAVLGALKSWLQAASHPLQPSSRCSTMRKKFSRVSLRIVQPTARLP